MYTPINMTPEAGKIKKKEFTVDVIHQDLFPHCNSHTQKIYFLGYMANKLIKTSLIPMTSSIKPIQTRYAGHHFRSRLEARWAVAFDSLEQRWDYEPQGFDLGKAGFYLPDFWLPDVQMWAEVKPDAPSFDEINKAVELANASGKRVLFLIGTPAPAAYWYIEPWGLERSQQWKKDNRTLFFGAERVRKREDVTQRFCKWKQHRES